VNVGDSMQHIVKGPLTLHDIIHFYKGGYGSPLQCGAHGMFLKYRRRHPRAATRNELNIPDQVERCHYEDEFAQSIGLPGWYDWGFQRITWSAQLFTNWMGDDAFLKRLHVRLLNLNLKGDTVWLRGTVTRKDIEGDLHLVQCEFYGENQRGETSLQGNGTVCLPWRHQGSAMFPKVPIGGD
jgi:hypothetical protein